MEFTGCFDNLMVDLLANKQKAVLTLNEDARQAFDELKDCEKLSITIKKYRQKRSLDANSYYWVLITKLAKKKETSNEEQHNEMIAEYGFPELIDGQLARIPLPDTDEADRIIRKSSVYHLKPTTQIMQGKDGVNYRTYIMMRGSSTYNTEEMARLIEGLIYECKSSGMLDAEIMTPDEKQQLQERFGVNVG